MAVAGLREIHETIDALRLEDRTLVSHHSSEHLPDQKELEASAFEVLKRLRLNAIESDAHLFKLDNFVKMKESRLFQTLKEMPKGAHLHIHSVAAASFEMWYESLITDPLIRVWMGHERETINLWGQEEVVLRGTIEYRVEGNCEKEGWVPITELPVGDVRDFFILAPPSATSIPDSSPLRPTTAPYPWSDFNDVWGRAKSIANSIDFWFGHSRGKESAKTEEERERGGLLWKLLEAQFSEGVIFVMVKTIMSLPYKKYTPEGKQEIVSLDDLMKMFARVVDLFKKEHPGFVGARLVFCCLKFETPEKVGEWAGVYAKLKQDYPNYVDGFDLVGHEDSLRPLHDYAKDLHRVLEEAKEKKIDAQYVMHAGESILPANDELYTALSLECPRIGHGFALIHHPTLIQMCKKANTILECCPISNHLLGYIADLRVHPSRALHRHGVKLTISSDDPGMFGYDLVTYDWMVVFCQWELSLADLYTFAKNSLEALEQKTQEIAIREFDLMWREWLLKVSKITFE